MEINRKNFCEKIHWIVNFANFTTFAFLFFYKIIAPDKKVFFCSFRMTIEIILFNYIYFVIFFKKSQSFKHSNLMHNLFARRNNDRDILSTIFRVDKSLFYVSKSWKSCNIIDTIKYQYKKLNMISQPRQTKS